MRSRVIVKRMVYNNEIYGAVFELWFDSYSSGARMNTYMFMADDEAVSNAAGMIEFRLLDVPVTKGSNVRLVKSKDGESLESMDDFGDVKVCASQDELVKAVLRGDKRICGIIDDIESQLSMAQKVLHEFLADLSKVATVIKSECMVIDDVTMGVRFLGGYGAWSGDEDVCDADVIDEKIGSKVHKFAKSYCKNHNHPEFSIEFSTGEKAWSYFEVKINKYADIM